MSAKEQNKKYYDNHREREIERVLEWKRKNRERVKHYMANNRFRWKTNKTKCKRCGIILNIITSEEICHWCTKEINENNKGKEKML